VCDARAFERVHSACVQRDESTVSVYAKNESLWTVVVAQNIHRDLRSYRCGVLRTDFQGNHLDSEFDPSVQYIESLVVNAIIAASIAVVAFIALLIAGIVILNRRYYKTAPIWVTRRRALWLIPGICTAITLLGIAIFPLLSAGLYTSHYGASYAVNSPPVFIEQSLSHVTQMQTTFGHLSANITEHTNSIIGHLGIVSDWNSELENVLLSLQKTQAALIDLHATTVEMQTVIHRGQEILSALQGIPGAPPVSIIPVIPDDIPQQIQLNINQLDAYIRSLQQLYEATSGVGSQFNSGAYQQAVNVTLTQLTQMANLQFDSAQEKTRQAGNSLAPFVAIAQNVEAVAFVIGIVLAACAIVLIVMTIVTVVLIYRLQRIPTVPTQISFFGMTTLLLFFFLAFAITFSMTIASADFCETFQDEVLIKVASPEISGMVQCSDGNLYAMLGFKGLFNVDNALGSLGLGNINFSPTFDSSQLDAASTQIDTMDRMITAPFISANVTQQLILAQDRLRVLNASLDPIQFASVLPQINEVMDLLETGLTLANRTEADRLLIREQIRGLQQSVIRLQIILLQLKQNMPQISHEIDTIQRDMNVTYEEGNCQWMKQSWDREMYAICGQFNTGMHVTWLAFLLGLIATFIASVLLLLLMKWNKCSEYIISHQNTKNSPIPLLALESQVQQQ